MPFIAYKITHRESGKAYIGITTRSLERRWRDHVSQTPYRQRRHLAHAIKKYGADAFDVEHIASSWNKSDLLDLERILVLQHETKSPSGYNLTDGGEGTWGRQPTEKTIQVFKTLNKQRMGIPLSAEHRAAIARGQTGLKRPPGTGAKIAAAKIGKPRSEETKSKIRSYWRSAEKIVIPEPVAKDIWRWLAQG